MSLMVCAECGTSYLPATACPHCGGDVFRFAWEEEDMPRATVEGGPSGHDEGVPAEEPPALPAKARSETVETKVRPPAKKAPPRPPLPDGS